MTCSEGVMSFLIPAYKTVFLGEDIPIFVDVRFISFVGLYRNRLICGMMRLYEDSDPDSPVEKSDGRTVKVNLSTLPIVFAYKTNKL